jgi:hypothetical protein
MDEEKATPMKKGDYEKVSFLHDEEVLDSGDEASDDALLSTSLHPDEDDEEAVVVNDNRNKEPPFWQRALHKTLLPDDKFMMGTHAVVEGSVVVKLLKFLFFTFGAITFWHWLIGYRQENDRDRNLKLWHIFLFEGNLIASDVVVFFLVGRLWKQRGIDHLAWLFWVVVCNIYFDSQRFFKFLQHSVTLYEMHCGKCHFCLLVCS